MTEIETKKKNALDMATLLPSLLKVAGEAKVAEDKLNAKLNALWRLTAAVGRKEGLTEEQIAACQVPMPVAKS